MKIPQKSSCTPIVFLILSIIVLAFYSCSQTSPPASPPNIVIINVDDMGWRDVSFMGSAFYSTPNMDRIAAGGMKFTNGYAAAANCAPSRASLMTGLWSPRHRIFTVASSERGEAKDRKIIPTPNTTVLDSSFTTFPMVLQEHGYTTCTAGKWHLSSDPTRFGFDVNIGGSKAGNPGTYYPPYRNVDLEAPNGEYLTDLIMTKSIEFIRNAQSPFLLYYTPYAVHTPIQPVDSLKHKYQDKPAWEGQNNVNYATMVENLDRNIGRLLETLEERKLMDNTLFIFTSDNGGLYGITYQRPLRAGKGNYYEGGIRVPFVFSWKGQIRAGSKSDFPITNMDIFPTLLDLIGIDHHHHNLDGQSLSNLLLDKAFTGTSRPLFWHFPIYLQAYDKNNNQSRDSLFRTRPGSVIRYGEWKLHHYFEDDGLELYNLENDIEEANNLTQEHPEKTKELYDLLDRWRKQVNAPVPQEPNPKYEGD